MHEERWAGQFQSANCAFPAKNLWEKKDAEKKRRWGLAGRMQRWNWNRSQWIRKQDSSFCLVVQPCIFCALHRSFCEPPCPAASRRWLIPRAALATETQRIMHKRWVQFIVFSWGPRGEQKLWIYVVRDWSRARAQGTHVQRGDWSGSLIVDESSAGLLVAMEADIIITG